MDDWHPIGLACGTAFAAKSKIDFYTAPSLSLVYVQPHGFALGQWLDVSLSAICALGVAAP